MKSYSVLLVASLAYTCLAENGVLQPTRLRCEYADEPLAVEVLQPHLSWQCTAVLKHARGLVQSAYQIQVAASPERLSDQADLWDSGKVQSDASHLIPYQGSALTSRQDAYWRVRVWDNENRASNWSPVNHFKMALLNAAEWQASWITDPQATEHVLQHDSWIWHGEPDSMQQYAPGTVYFRKHIHISHRYRIHSAVFAASCDNNFTLYINGRPAMYGQDGDVTLQSEVSDFLQQDENVLAIVAVNSGRQAGPAGLIGHLTITYHDSTQIRIAIDRSWSSSAIASDGWMAADFDDRNWRPAHLLGPFGMPPWQENTALAASLPVFRKSTVIDKPVQRALLYVCGLGQYEALINGRRVGDQVMAPGWTRYRKSCLYDTYDVTTMMRNGENVLAVLLGNGMFNVQGGRYIKFRSSFGRPQLILQLEIEHTDGSRSVVVSDQSWKTKPGPILFSCIFGGEDYDRRQEPRGWADIGFKDQGWHPAQRCAGPGGMLTSSTAPPTRVMETLATRHITNPRPGVYVYDLGQNFAGWPAITVSGPGGARIRLTPGELLNEQGLVSQKSSGSPVYFSYILNGEGREKWTPRFTYYGFRYVQVEGAVPESQAAAADKVILHDLHGQFLHADAERVGDFTCSNSLINRIHRLILSAIRSNLQSVLTDCPHREKLGWLEVSHLLFRGITYNYFLPAFYGKIERDIRESQLENGLIPDIAPEFTVFWQGFRDSPEWGSAGVFNPWYVRETYADDRLLRACYPEMKKYVDYLAGTAKDHIVSHGLGDWYDIGPADPGPSQLTSTGLTATAIYYGDLNIVAETARLLNKPDEAALYAGRAAAVRKAFNARFFHADSSRYDRGSQTAQAMPLVLNLVDESKRKALAASLAEVVRKNGTRVTAGDVGFMYLVRSLTEAGYNDLLYDLVCQENGPGYAEQLRKNATTLTEAWDANPASSQNHCMLGHAEEWFYNGLAGIGTDADKPGFKRVIVKPAFVPALDYVQAHHDSPFGRIEVFWKRQGREIVLQVTVPANCEARVFLPARSMTAIKESGQPVNFHNGIRQSGVRQTLRWFDIGSGDYTFQFPASPR